MSGKFLIFGATGSIGSSLAEQMKTAGYDNVHLVSRNQSEVESIASKYGFSFTVADVLEDGFIAKVKNDLEDAVGIAYCVGSIDLKPFKMVTENDFNKCMKLNLYSGFLPIRLSTSSFVSFSRLRFKLICIKRLVLTSIVVSLSCEGFISPKPLNLLICILSIDELNFSNIISFSSSLFA